MPLVIFLTSLDSNRKATGVRLGQLVQKDLKKKERSTTANRDPHLELNITGKELGEDGIKVVCGSPDLFVYNMQMVFFPPFNAMLSNLTNCIFHPAHYPPVHCDILLSLLKHQRIHCRDWIYREIGGT
jgi:hypothetical protein